MARVLFHIDLNAFFASAEEIRHPEYKDKPMAVGSLSSRGVLSTANYAARKKGVHSAMPVFQAQKLCPELVIVPGDYGWYRELSGKFFNILKRFSPMLEPVSIDECFVDVTVPIRQYKRPLDMAVQIQQTVLEELGLQCSIGVAPTRFLAKMASDMRKPMGITVLRKSEIPAKLWSLPVSDMVGIGKKTVPLLEKAGIKTIGDLADPENEETVKKILGRNGLSMIQKARGQSSDRLIFSNTQKSLSMSRTYPTDIYTIEETLSKARELTWNLARKLKQDGQKGMLVSVVLRDVDFRNQVRSRQLDFYTDQFEVLYETVQALIEENFAPDGYRHIGVSVGSLLKAEKIIEQPTIFEVPQDTTQDVLNRLNKSLGTHAFKKASDLLKENQSEGPVGQSTKDGAHG